MRAKESAPLGFFHIFFFLKSELNGFLLLQPDLSSRMSFIFVFRFVLHFEKREEKKTEPEHKGLI